MTKNIKNVITPSSNQDNNPNSRKPYVPGVEFYDGGFDPNCPSNSPEFAKALLAHMNITSTSTSKKPYVPGLEFYDGGFDPNRPSNSPEFAKALLNNPTPSYESEGYY